MELRRTFFTAVALAATLALVTIFRAEAQTLMLGDPAPKLEVKEFLKGKPVAAFEKGKTYVVDFWATWRGPCRLSIPHLTELQKKYRDLTFIGVSVLEREPSKVKPYVAEMGSRMGYCVAMDKVPAGAKPDEGRMAKTWMEAAGQDGVPTAFVVNGEGKIAWIGNPMHLDEPLEKIVSGTYDLAKIASEQRRAATRQAKMQALQSKLRQAGGDPGKMLEVMDKVVSDDPSMEEVTGLGKLTLMVQTNADSNKVLEYARHLSADVLNKDPQQLNAVAWTLVDPERKKQPAELTKLALEIAQRADDVAEKKDGAVADTLALAYYLNGDVAKAVETQERAVKLVKGTPFEADKTIPERLEKYRKAAAEKK